MPGCGIWAWFSWATGPHICSLKLRKSGSGLSVNLGVSRLRRTPVVRLVLGLPRGRQGTGPLLPSRPVELGASQAASSAALQWPRRTSAFSPGHQGLEPRRNLPGVHIWEPELEPDYV